MACGRFKNRNPFRLISFRCFLTMHKGTTRIMSVIALLIIYTKTKHRTWCQTIFYIFMTSLEKLICIHARFFILIIGLCLITCIQSRGLLDNLKFDSFNNYFFDEQFHSINRLNNCEFICILQKRERSQLFCNNRLLLTLVGVTGFEPAASWSRTKRSTKLSHTPFFHALKLYHICGGLSIFFLQLLSFFCFPDCGDERCRFASRRRGRVRASCIGKCQMLFVFPIGRQARSLFHATVRLKILHRFANISFSK